MEVRYDDFRKRTLAEVGLSSSDEDDDGEEATADKTRLALVMVDEQTGNK